MKEYFMTVVVTAAIGGVIEEFLPDKSGMRPYVRLAVGLSVLLALVVPFAGILSEVGSFLSEGGALFESAEEAGDGVYESIFEDAMDDAAATEAERRIARALTEQYGIAEEDCRVALVRGDGGETERVLIVLSGTAVFQDPYVLTAYINERYGCPSDVVIE